MSNATQKVVSRAANNGERGAQFVRDGGDEVHLRFGELTRASGVEHERDARRQN